jgi:VanZ family protein
LYAPALLWAALLLFIGGRRDVPTVESGLPLDKAAHFVAYGILSTLVTMAWLRTGRPQKLAWVLVLALLVGVVDELHQRTVPGRSAEVLDWFADAAGIIVAALLVLRYMRGSSHVV